MMAAIDDGAGESGVSSSPLRQLAVVAALAFGLVALIVSVIAGVALWVTSGWKNPNDLRYHLYEFALEPYGVERYRVHDNGGQPPVIIDIVLDSDVTESEIFQFKVSAMNMDEALADMPRRWRLCLFAADGEKLHEFGLGREWCSFGNEYTENPWMTRSEFEALAAREPSP